MAEAAVYEAKLLLELVDDFAVSVVARETGHQDVADFLLARSQNYRKIFNNDTGFMEARLSNGSWAGEDVGWTEGDKWAYTFDVMHDVPGLYVDRLSLGIKLMLCLPRIELKGGNASFVQFLDEHFDGG